jgi:hypothetical protein
VKRTKKPREKRRGVKGPPEKGDPPKREASQAKILIPVGIAITMVAAVK